MENKCKYKYLWLPANKLISELKSLTLDVTTVQYRSKTKTNNNDPGVEIMKVKQADIAPAMQDVAVKFDQINFDFTQCQLANDLLNNMGIYGLEDIASDEDAYTLMNHELMSSLISIKKETLFRTAMTQNFRYAYLAHTIDKDKLARKALGRDVDNLVSIFRNMVNGIRDAMNKPTTNTAPAP